MIEEPRARLFSAGQRATRWNPYTHLGETVGQFNWPFPDYPPALLYRVLPSWLAKGLLSILHLAAAGALMLLYLRWRGLSLPAALVGAMAFELSTVSTFWLEASFFHWPMAPWAVLSLWGAEACVRSPSLRAGTLAGAALGGAILAGHPQNAVLLSLVVAAIVAVGEGGPRPASARGLALGALVLTSALVGSARLVPLASEFLAGARGAVPYEDYYATSVRLGPQHLLSAVFPDLFGHPVRGFNLLKGGALESYANHQEVRFHVGLPVLILALSGVGRRPRTRALAVLVGLALLFSLESPLGRILHALPGFGSSSPSRVLWVVHLLVPVLAACGFERLRRGDERVLKAAVGLLIGALVVSLLCTLPSFVRAVLFPALDLSAETQAEAARKLTEGVIGPFSRGALAPGEAAGFPGLHVERGGGRSGLLLSPTLGPVLLLAATAGAVWLCLKRDRRLGAALVAGLLAGELVQEGLVYNPSSAPEAAYPTTPAIDRTRELAGEGRVLLDRGLRENSLMPYGVRAVGGYGSMQSKELVDLLRALGCPPPRQYVSPKALPPAWRDAFAVTAVITAHGKTPTVPDGLVKEFDDGKAAVWRNETALPRARLHTWGSVKRVSTHAEALAAVVAPEFDPLTMLVLGTHPLAAHGVAPAAPTPLSMVVDEPERVVVRVDAPTAEEGGVLVLADGWGTGWSASAGGESLELLVANVALRAVALPGGFNGDVEFTYEAPGVEAGHWITFLALLALLLYWRWGNRLQSAP